MLKSRCAAAGALVASGAAQAWIAAPHSWIALHPIAWVPVLAVCSRLAGRRAFLAGWLAGSAANAVIFAWLVPTIDSFTSLGPAIGALALALFAAAHGLHVGVFACGLRAIRRGAGGAWPIAVAAWFTACEFLAPHFFLYRQGVAWFVEPRVFLASATTGVSGITFLVLLANALVLAAIEALHTRRGGAALAGNALVFAALVGAALLLASRQEARIAAAEAQATPIRVALVQPGDDPHAAPARSVGEARARADALAEQARHALAADRRIEVVVLPEKALEFEPSRSWNRSVRELAPAFGVELWTGGAALAERATGAHRYYNSAFRVLPDGREAPRYDKNMLVPFGEWMPDRLAWVSDALGRSRFAPGRGMPLQERGAARFAFLICYEAIRPEYVREPVRRGANLLVNLTYDGWFGDTAEPAQHLMLVAAQAAQLGVPILRSTTTGLSALIDARGTIPAQTQLFEKTTLVGDARPLAAPGLYAAWGDWFASACVAISAAWLAAGLVHGRRAQS